MARTNKYQNIMTIDTIAVDKSKILEAVEEHPETAEVLKSLFPEVFEERKTFCKIGSVLKRTKYPNEVYAIFKWNGEVRLLNISGNYMWKNAIIKVSQLADPNGISITVCEFAKLSGGCDDFCVAKVHF